MRRMRRISGTTWTALATMDHLLTDRGDLVGTVDYGARTRRLGQRPEGVAMQIIFQYAGQVALLQPTLWQQQGCLMIREPARVCRLVIVYRRRQRHEQGSNTGR